MQSVPGFDSHVHSGAGFDWLVLPRGSQRKASQSEMTFLRIVISL